MQLSILSRGVCEDSLRNSEFPAYCNHAIKQAVPTIGYVEGGVPPAGPKGLLTK